MVSLFGVTVLAVVSLCHGGVALLFYFVLMILLLFLFLVFPFFFFTVLGCLGGTCISCFTLSLWFYACFWFVLFCFVFFFASCLSALF